MDMERRIILFMILSVFILLFFSSVMRKQQQQQQPVTTPEPSETPFESVTTIDGKPTSPSLTTKTDQIAQLNETDEALVSIDEAEKVYVTTDKFMVTFSTIGAKPISWLVSAENGNNKNIEDVSDNTAPITMIDVIPQTLAFTTTREFPFDVTLLEYGKGIHNEFKNMVYEVRRDETNEGDIRIEFLSPANQQNIRLKKTYLFRPEQYLVDLAIEIINEGDARLIFDYDGAGMSIIWGAGLGDLDTGMNNESRYYYAIFNQDNNVKKVTPKRNKPYSFTGNILWGGMESRFFLTALISPNEPFQQFTASIKERNLLGLTPEEIKIYSRSLTTVELSLPRFTLEPGQVVEYKVEAFIGPKYYDVLKNIGYGMQKSLFGWLRPLCVLLLKIMQLLYNVVHNYGLAIILLTILIRLATYPLTIKGMRIQAKFTAEQQRIRPLIEELNQKYKDNPALKNKKLMELYKEHKINPLAPLRGCLPMLMQMPIFIALYILLMQAIELKGQPFLWIDDLSGPDKFMVFKSSLPLIGHNLNLLPILMGVSQILISRITTPGGAVDPMQKQMALLFPLIFTFILYNFPSGLILYWLVSNVLQVGQQVIVNKHVRQHMSELQQAEKK